MQSLSQSAAVARPFAATTKKQATASRPATASPRSVVTASLKRDSGDERKVGKAAAIALAAVVPFASCCVGANKAVGAEIASVFSTNVAMEEMTTNDFQLATLGDEPAFEKLKKWSGEEQPGQRAADKFSKLKVPGLPSGGDILKNAPHVGTGDLPTMPDASEAIPKAGRNW